MSQKITVTDIDLVVALSMIYTFHPTERVIKAASTTKYGITPNQTGSNPRFSMTERTAGTTSIITDIDSMKQSYDTGS